MLAIKTALAETDQTASLVFDEIDTGVGGEVAVAVGEHLSSLSRHKQVLAITHLATIAVRADNHIRVEKRAREKDTVTEIEVVAGEQRVEEIARMLAGDRKGQTSRTHAQEMLKKYGPNSLT
jgi:DNA repair protein RecN (Recombination protein N)